MESRGNEDRPPKFHPQIGLERTRAKIVSMEYMSTGWAEYKRINPPEKIMRKLGSQSRFLSTQALMMLLVLETILCCTPPVMLAEPAAIKIGVSVPLTGPSATYGADIRDVLLFANKKLANGRYQFVIEDDKCINREAVNVAHKLIDVDKVKYVLGFGCSGSVLATAPLYEKAGVVTVVATTSSPRIAKAGDYIFRTFPNMRTGTELLARYIDNKHSMFGVLSEETDYAQDLKQLFLNTVKHNASLRVSSEDFAGDIVDFKPLLERLKGQGTDGLLINTQSEAVFDVILKQIREGQWKVPLYGVFWPGSPSLLSKAREGLEGVVYIDTPCLDDILSHEGRKIYEEYKSIYGPPRSIEAIFATTFEAFRALSAAIESGQDTRKYLYTNQFPGLFGVYRFDTDGEIVGIAYVLKVIREGKPSKLNH
jgi:branched-chain amino acid transport system substrate-binding protein